MRFAWVNEAEFNKAGEHDNIRLIQIENQRTFGRLDWLVKRMNGAKRRKNLPDLSGAILVATEYGWSGMSVAIKRDITHVVDPHTFDMYCVSPGSGWNTKSLSPNIIGR